MSSLVSVIIPTYNRAHCLPLAISSVLAQTYQNFEIIVVDDNSSDSTKQICHRLQEFDGRIHYMRNDKNFGPAKSRNNGIEKAKGEFITFLDSDDLYYTDKIQLQVEALEKNPSVGFCYGYFACTHDIFETKNYDFKKWDSSLNLYPSFLLPNNFFIVTPAVMLRCNLLRKVGGFDSDMKICEDLELWSRILLHTGSICITRPIVAIHIRKDDQPDYFYNILARDQLYQRVIAHDPNLDQNLKKSLYQNLIRLYLANANLQSPKLSHVVNVLKKMTDTQGMPFEDMRAKIIQLAGIELEKMQSYELNKE